MQSCQYRNSKKLTQPNFVYGDNSPLSHVQTHGCNYVSIEIASLLYKLKPKKSKLKVQVLIDKVSPQWQTSKVVSKDIP